MVPVVWFVVKRERPSECCMKDVDLRVVLFSKPQRVRSLLKFSLLPTLCVAVVSSKLVSHRGHYSKKSLKIMIFIDILLCIKWKVFCFVHK